MAKKQAARAAVLNPVPAKTVWLERAEEFVHRRSLPLFLVLLGLASVRIVATYDVFNHTIDEPAHIACGMEWLDKKVYRYETQHPPLARVMTAIGPYLDGAHSWGRPEKYNEGAAILYTGNRYDRELALARIGILPFFWLASLVVYLWSRRYFGAPVAVYATLCFSFLPPVLAHGGLATTDMALTATFGAAFLTMLMWLERPSWGRSALFGAALAASILSKFSVLAFFPAATVATLVCYFVFERPSVAQGHGAAETAFIAAGAGGRHGLHRDLGWLSILVRESARTGVFRRNPGRDGAQSSRTSGLRAGPLQ